MTPHLMTVTSRCSECISQFRERGRLPEAHVSLQLACAGRFWQLGVNALNALCKAAAPYDTTNNDYAIESLCHMPSPSGDLTATRRESSARRPSSYDVLGRRCCTSLCASPVC
jgi:hypothetical protein